MQKRFNVKRCIFVGDNAMATPDNITLLRDKYYEYITRKSPVENVTKNLTKAVIIYNQLLINLQKEGGESNRKK